jgi:hypothetical protein
VGLLWVTDFSEELFTSIFKLLSGFSIPTLNQALQLALLGAAE